MTDTADPIGHDDWLSAAEALRRVELVMGEYQARHAIAARAHDGLVRSRAERFIKHRETFDDAELPKEFWWAEGHEALEQNWVAGDFSTWINRTWQWKAYGVRFLESDIAKLIPAPKPEVQPSQDDEFVPSAEALHGLVKACGDEAAAAGMLLEWAKAGELVVKTRTYRAAWEGGPITTEQNKILSAEDWDRFEDIEPVAFKAGIASATGWDSFERNTVTVRMTGIHFDRSGLATLLQSLPATREPTAAEGSMPGDDSTEWVSARDAVYRIMGATHLDAVKSLYSIIAYAKTGDVQARALLLSEEGRRRGSPTRQREERNALVPDWFWQKCTDYDSSALNWRSGVFAGRGYHEGASVSVTLTGVQFDARGLDILDPPRLSEAASVTRAALSKPGPSGRPTAGWWEDLIIDVFAKVHWGDLKPERQSDIEDAMQRWLEDRGESAAVSTVRKRARKLWGAIHREDEK